MLPCTRAVWEARRAIADMGGMFLVGGGGRVAIGVAGLAGLCGGADFVAGLEGMFCAGRRDALSSESSSNCVGAGEGAVGLRRRADEVYACDACSSAACLLRMSLAERGAC